MEKKKSKVIIDCDPGVDDSAAIILSLFDEVMDIKLFTTVSGNLPIDTVTRNILHILELYDRTDIPVAKGATKAMFRVSKDAAEVHKKEGMGGYIPPASVKTQPIKEDAVEAMYKVIKENANDICILALGPHTNLGYLLTKHPDVAGMVNHIYTEGCAPYGWTGQGKRWKTYRSFNASYDPEAVDIVVRSGIPITYVPSRMGREIAKFNEKEVYGMAEINDTGRFISTMYQGYWERGYKDRRVANNDTCAVLAFRNPSLFKTKKVFFAIDTTILPGRTFMTPDKDGNVNYVYDVDIKRMHRYFYNAINKLNDKEFYGTKIAK